MNQIYKTTEKWVDFNYELYNQLLTKDHLLTALNSLWINVLNKHSEDLSIQIQFKVKLDEGIERSISYLQTVTKNEKDLLFDIFYTFWELRHDDYYVAPLNSIIFTYRFVKPSTDEDKIKISKPKLLQNLNTEGKPKDFKFLGFNLPTTMDITLWGTVTFSSDYTFAKVSILNTKQEFHVNLFEDYQIVNLKINNRTILSFKDQMKERYNLHTFVRKLNDQEYEFINSQLIIKKHKCKVDFMKKLDRDVFKGFKFLTLDLETRTINGNMKPYCVSIFDGNLAVSFYLSEFKNEEEMLTASIKYLMVRKYDQYRIYIHNFSYFDSIFLIKILSNLTENIKPIIRDGKIIDLRFKFKGVSVKVNKFYTLYFRDSYLLLPSSLANLAKQFNVENKTIFPYLFVNQTNVSLNYKGVVPAFKFFVKFSMEDYNNYVQSYLDSNWDLKKETIKYCEQDVRSLYQVLDKFSAKIFDLFRLDIHKYPTLPSLALAIFRSKFLDKFNNIPLISGKIYNDLKRGYTGGSVDAFIPTGTNIYQYDVNSLYPFVMSDKPVPVGVPSYFEGDITKITPNAFGIFDVEVETPNNLNVPILQTKIKTNQGGFRTISPLGKWTDVYFSEEIYNAKKYGYKFKIKRGYLFEKGYIFKDYVESLYDLKLNSAKNSPNYIVSKLLLNSLYGKLGMNPDSLNHVINFSNLLHKYYAKYDIVNMIDLKNGKELISYWEKNKYYSSKNISVPISLAVTAWGRIHMAQLKMELTKAGSNIYYSDTDSLFLDKPLDAKYVGDELGKMKLENVFTEAVFLCPKVYGGLTIKGETYIKIKGLKNPISFSDLKSLLTKESRLKIKQEKWYRNLSESNITVKDEIYSLIATENKRVLIYDNNNNLINTKPKVLFS